MAAMVAPVGVEDAELRLGGIPPFGAEVMRHLAEVVRVHGEAMGLAEGLIAALGQVAEARQVLQRLHVALLPEVQDGQVLLPAFHGVDEVGPDLRQRLFGSVVSENQQPRAADPDVGRRVDEVDAGDGGGGTLVELAGNVFHGDVFLPLQGETVGDGVRGQLSEYAVTALLQQRVGKAVQVVHLDEPEGGELQGQVLVELREETGRLHPECFPFLYKDASSLHNL